jgi:hypothetical protein
MRKTVTFVAIVLLVALVAYLGLFQRNTIIALFKQKYAEARGYKPAQTPDEALEYFRSAIKDRDYETAAKYCGPEFEEQMRKAAPAAQALGKKIDDFREALNKRSLASDNTRLALALLEPFPPDFEILEVKKQGDDKAIAVIGERADKEFKTPPHTRDWNMDWVFCRALTKSLPVSPMKVELRREGDGDRKQWKIYFPVTPALHQGVDRLREKHKDYINALDKLDQEIKVEATTKADVDARMRTELENARQ